MELRERIALAIAAANDKDDDPWEVDYEAADRILSLPEIKEGEQLRHLCYLHDGPGGVSVQMRAVGSATPQPQS